MPANNVPPLIRKAIIAVYHGRCQYCRADGANHVDHIVPRLNGGASELDNLTLACVGCNLRKSWLDLSPGFVEIMQARARRKLPAIEQILARLERRPSLKPPKHREPPGYFSQITTPFGVTLAHFSGSTLVPGFALSSDWWAAPPETMAFEADIANFRVLITREDCPTVVADAIQARAHEILEAARKHAEETDAVAAAGLTVWLANGQPSHRQLTKMMRGSL